MEGVQTPVIPVIGDLIRATPGAISLGQGVVSYGPPREAIERAARFVASGEDHKYRPVQGIPELIDAIRAKHRAEQGFDPDEATRAVVVTAGGNMAFTNALMSIADPGDEVILPTPYYFNHEMAIAMASCRAVLVPTDGEYQLRPEAIAAAITPRTRAVVTVSPNNPSGAVYPEPAIRRVNEICRSAGVYHVSDEAYEYFTYDGARHFSPLSIDSADAHTIGLYSLSKSYGFAGWRIGWMVVPAHLLTAVKKVQDTILICPPVVSQHAACGALAAGRGYCDRHLAELGEVREIVLSELDGLGDLATVPRASGAFYVLVRLNREVPSTMGLIERLVREFGVGVLPGETFGIRSQATLRVAYGALSKASVAEGIGRLVKGLRAILGTG
jgi:aspartate/methionine/tyrosine aminotransferase